MRISTDTVPGRPWRICQALLTLPMTWAAVAARAHLAPVTGGPGGGWDPWIALPLTAGAVLYAIGAARAWRRAGTGRGVTRPQAACFYGGMLVLAIALVSPFDALGEQLLVAHVGQHMLLLMLAPPLLVLGRPALALIRTVPPGWRGGAARLFRGPWLGRAASWLGRPGPATLVQLAVVLAWLAPGAMTLALRDDLVHALMHVSLLGAGLLFWAALLRRPAARGAAIVSLLVTTKMTVLVGALLAFAPRPIYAVYAGRGAAWGLGLLEDHQLAGVLMMTGGPMMYLAAALALLGRGLAGSGTGPRVAAAAGLER